MDPLTLGALSAGGSLLFSSLVPKPKLPDLVGERLNQTRRAQARLDKSLDRRSDRAQEDLAAAGVSGSGAGAVMQRLYESGNDATADLAAREADALANARNRMEGLRFQRDQQEYANRIGAIGQGASTIATAGLFNSLQPTGGQVTGGADGMVSVPQVNPLEVPDDLMAGGLQPLGRAATQNPMYFRPQGYPAADLFSGLRR